MLRNRFGRLFAVAFLAFVQHFVVQDRLAQAATLEWVRQFGTSSNDLGTAISADRLGNVFVAGRTRGNLGGTNAGGDDAFVRKYDAAGNVQWTTQLGTATGETTYSISADGLGNAFVVGTTYTTLDARPFYFTVDSFVSKLGDSGHVEWTGHFAESTQIEARGVSADGLGNVYVAGHALVGTFPSVEFEGFLVKFDVAGNALWKRQFGTSEFDYCYAVSADMLGNVFVAGSSDVIGVSAYLTKFDPTGNQEWTQYFGNEYVAQSLSVSADGNGNAYIAGSKGGGLNRIVTPIITSLTKFDENGSLQWSRATEATYSRVISDPVGNAMGVTADGNGSVYLSGYVENQNSYLDMYLTKYDELGNHLWSEQLASAALDASPSVATDGLGNVYIGGYTAGDLSGTNLGGYDAVVAKFSDPAVPEPASWQLLTIFFMAWWCHRRSV